MSGTQDSGATQVMEFFWGVSLILFLAVKVGGVSFAAWSWWWLLMPQVPVVALVLQKLGWL